MVSTSVPLASWKTENNDNTSVVNECLCFLNVTNDIDVEGMDKKDIMKESRLYICV